MADEYQQVDTYDIMLNHFLNEGYQREDIIKAMSSLSEEPISSSTRWFTCKGWCDGC